MRKQLAIFITLGLVALLVAGLAGQFVRDRWIITALVFYIPLLPLGLVAGFWDLTRRGRSLPRGRFVVTTLAAGAVVWSVVHMMAWSTPAPAGEAAGGGNGELRLLHWNVRWGGGRRGPVENWQSIVDEIITHQPDVLLISEAPRQDRIDMLARQLGDDWRVAAYKGDASSGYWYDMAVLARWPVERLDSHALPNGAAMTARVQTPSGALNVMMVDGEAGPLKSRRQLLAEATAVIGRCDTAGAAIDVVAGDFNTPSRSIGFDAFRTGAAYQLASTHSGTWRGTWPTWVPVYDIDHVWIGGSRSIRSCKFISDLHSDHRGQVVIIGWPEAVQ